MKISILQISDIHLKESGNTATNRVDFIKRAAQGAETDVDVYEKRSECPAASGGDE